MSKQWFYFVGTMANPVWLTCGRWQDPWDAWKDWKSLRPTAYLDERRFPCIRLAR